MNHLPHLSFQKGIANTIFLFGISGVVLGFAVGFAVRHIAAVNEMAKLKPEITASPVSTEFLYDKNFENWSATIRGTVQDISRDSLTIKLTIKTEGSASPAVIKIGESTSAMLTIPSEITGERPELQQIPVKELSAGDMVNVFVRFRGESFEVVNISAFRQEARQ